MNFLQQLQARLMNFEKKEFYKYTSIYFGVMLTLIFGIIYYYFSTVHTLKMQLKKINRNREDVRVLLQKHKFIEKQKEKINEILSEEKNFKIKNFFDGLLEQHGLKGLLRRESEVSEEVLYKKYTEIKLVAHLNQINTEQMCQLLDSIEQKARVYIKELIITKTRGASLDVSLTIATLKPQSELKAQK